MNARVTLAFAALVFAACDVAHLDLGGGAGSRSGRPFSLGGHATCILGTDSVLRCYGTATLGRFSVDPSTLAETCLGEPCAIMQPVHVTESVATAFAVGDDFVCAVLDGTTRCFGGNAAGTLGRGVHDRDPHPTGIVIDGSFVFEELVAGRAHVCGRTTTGEVACWGHGSHGELGRDPSTLADCGPPIDVAEASRLGVGVADTLRCAEAAALVPGLVGVTELRAGPFATCALTATEGWRCFGRNVDGSLGVVSASAAVITPTVLAPADVVDVSLGPTHGCVATTNGQVRCFGHGEFGQLGVGMSAPDTCTTGPCALASVRVADVPIAHRVAVGDAHSCALVDDGSIVCFGSDAQGQVGDSGAAGDDCSGAPCARSPHAVAHMATFTSVAARGDGTCAHARDGEIHCWGDGRHGELGNFPARSLDYPAQIDGIP